MSPAPSLSVVEEAGKTKSQQAAELMEQARTLARSAVQELMIELNVLENTAVEIRSGGDIYSSGIREEARQISEFIEGAHLRLGKLMSNPTT